METRLCQGRKGKPVALWMKEGKMDPPLAAFTSSRCFQYTTKRSCFVSGYHGIFTAKVGHPDYFICSSIYPIHKSPHINKLDVQLGLINKPPDWNQTDDLAADAHQRHSR